MPTYIKTGYWEKRVNPKQGYKGELNLENLITSLIPAATSPIQTNGTSLYSTNPSAGSVNNNNGIFLGAGAGSGTSIVTGLGTASAVFIGKSAGTSATNADSSVFLGNRAGYQATNAYRSQFIGWYSGNGATNAQFSNFIGNAAGQGATSANNSNFIGNEAGKNSTGNNVNAIGYRAGLGNALSGMTIISNSSLPSYANRTAATTAITIPNGAVAGNTYLYYNQATFAIEGVRL